MNNWYQNALQENELTRTAIKRLKKRPKSRVGKMEGAYNPPNWSKKLDTRLTPVHRYVLQEDQELQKTAQSRLNPKAVI